MKLLALLFSFEGRASRSAMALITLAFILVSMVRGQLVLAGAVVAADILLGVQIIMMWPAWAAVPVKRFHDMGRSWWWVAVFWGAALASLWFLWMGLGAQGSVFGMSTADVLRQPETYVQKVASLNEANPDQKAMKPLGGVAMGGVSLSMIFLIIQFGWLHFIPGTVGPNRFGAGAPAGDEQTR